MFGGHLPELVILLVVALVVFGPKRLPEIGGAMGKGIKEFRRGTQELEDHVSGKETIVETPSTGNTHTNMSSGATINKDRDAG